MFIKAIMLGLIAGIGILDSRLMGVTMIERPLVTAMLVGIVLGDLKQGIIIGAQLELIWMGIAGIGAATPPDVVTGGVLGTAFAIISGQGASIALALAVPIAVLAQSLGILIRVINTYFAHKADEYAKEVNYKGIALCLWIPILLFFLSTFLPTFLAILLGADKVSGLINAIPKVIIEGLQVAGNLLPAVGFALLMDMLFTKKMAVFFFLGCLMAAYGGLDITAVALIATCLGILIHFYIKNSSDNSNTTDNKLTEGEIDFD